MLQFMDEHREEGKALQVELVGFQEELSRTIEEVWTRPPGSDSKGVMSRAQDGTTEVNVLPGMGEPAKSQDPLDKISKPQMVEPTWRVKLWERKQ